ncbi:hypothetical protein TSH100_04030 [Azospirillum sp. TSH100]|uniref:hypothetical protein n=1 Tax=Azospirillum sp. TSH100 TaxID=652764 RepID=UPI000D614671|nr:hypothetical protein [Azospirillum sp. TSH100]PWC89815.1 hypothetical protein TSH100_04030 [Azospirillum sp. TSH100]QCG92355.1 hypothetical protein E6C72_31620 [Azospirillum sp. TSH100]
MPRRLTRERRKLATSLAYWFGAAGERQSAADIAAKLPARDQRTPRTKEIVAGKMWGYVAHGWAVPAPGPRGGAGWVLSEAGAALLARVAEEDRAAAQRGEAFFTQREAAAREIEARKVEYLAQLDGPAGRERVSLRALTIEEAAGLAGREARRRPTGTRVRGLWEAGTDLEGGDQS